MLSFHFSIWLALCDFTLLSCSTSLACDSSLASKASNPAFSLFAPKFFAALALLTHFPFFGLSVCAERFLHTSTLSYAAELDSLLFSEPKVCVLSKPRTFSLFAIASIKPAVKQLFYFLHSHAKSHLHSQITVYVAMFFRILYWGMPQLALLASHHHPISFSPKI
jgi:hypothetical protein